MGAGATDAFFDTNVLLYLISSDRAKADRAEGLLSSQGTVSVQVLNEFADVALRKCRSSWKQVHEVLEIVRSLCSVREITLETHDLGLAVAERQKFRICDSMIIAAAMQAGCRTLLSEDMQHGQRVETLTIVNPFLEL